MRPKIFSMLLLLIIFEEKNFCLDRVKHWVFCFLSKHVNHEAIQVKFKTQVTRPLICLVPLIPADRHKVLGQSRIFSFGILIEESMYVLNLIITFHLINYVIHHHRFQRYRSSVTEKSPAISILPLPVFLYLYYVINGQ